MRRPIYSKSARNTNGDEGDGSPGVSFQPCLLFVLWVNDRISFLLRESVELARVSGLKGFKGLTRPCILFWRNAVVKVCTFFLFFFFERMLCHDLGHTRKNNSLGKRDVSKANLERCLEKVEKRLLLLSSSMVSLVRFYNERWYIITIEFRRCSRKGVTIDRHIPPLDRVSLISRWIDFCEWKSEVKKKKKK